MDGVWRWLIQRNGGAGRLRSTSLQRAALTAPAALAASAPGMPLWQQRLCSALACWRHAGVALSQRRNAALAASGAYRCRALQQAVGAVERLIAAPSRLQHR